MMVSALPPAVRLGEAAPRPQRCADRPVRRPMRPPTVIRLWLPLTPLFLLLAPFALLLTPLFCLVRRPRGLSPLAAVLALGGVLLALGGTDVDVEAPDAIVRLKIV